MIKDLMFGVLFVSEMEYLIYCTYVCLDRRECFILTFNVCEICTCYQS